LVHVIYSVVSGQYSCTIVLSSFHFVTATALSTIP